MSNEITIKKSDLWKYSTFVLVAVVLLGSVFMFTGSSNSNAINNGGGANEDPIDMDVFLDNPNLYPSIGPNDAKNVVVELSDFQCSHCGIASGIPSWTEDYSTAPHYNSAGSAKQAAKNGEIRFIYVPLAFLGQESVYAAQSVLCANQQGKFWEMHDAIFEASTTPQGNDGKYSKANLKGIASGINGLDTNEFNNCLDSDETVSDVQRATANVQSMGIQIGTPKFFVNGEKVQSTWDSIQAAFV
jgi:protein-disulfide isomerase|tara:strand:- start:5021 stop:5752 length:732 start_codon:yes stop_codon:yes gene_type:complete